MGGPRAPSTRALNPQGMGVTVLPQQGLWARQAGSGSPLQMQNGLLDLSEPTWASAPVTSGLGAGPRALSSRARAQVLCSVPRHPRVSHRKGSEGWLSVSLRRGRLGCVDSAHGDVSQTLSAARATQGWEQCGQGDPGARMDSDPGLWSQLRLASVRRRHAHPWP